MTFKYRITTNPERNWPFKVEEKIFGFWRTRLKTSDVETAESQIKDAVWERIQKSTKSVVIKEYTEEDFLVDKLKGNA